METARAFEPETPAEAAPATPLQLVVLGQTEPSTWFQDLWTYIELTEDDLG